MGGCICCPIIRITRTAEGANKVFLHPDLRQLILLRINCFLTPTGRTIAGDGTAGLDYINILHTFFFGCLAKNVFLKAFNRRLASFFNIICVYIAIYASCLYLNLDSLFCNNLLVVHVTNIIFFFLAPKSLQN